MKTTVISLVIFILAFASLGLFLKDGNVPILSQLGKDINQLINPSYIEPWDELEVSEESQQVSASEAAL